MTGPVEMQTNFVRGPQAAEKIAHLSNVEQIAQEAEASEMAEKTKRETESTPVLKKAEQQETKSSTEEQNKNQYMNFKRENESDDEENPAEDEYRGHFLDVHL